MGLISVILRGKERFSTLVSTFAEAESVCGLKEGIVDFTDEETGVVLYQGPTPLAKMNQELRLTFLVGSHFHESWAEELKIYLQLYPWVSRLESFASVESYALTGFTQPSVRRYFMRMSALSYAIYGNKVQFDLNLSSFFSTACLHMLVHFSPNNEVKHLELYRSKRTHPYTVDKVEHLVGIAKSLTKNKVLVDKAFYEFLKPFKGKAVDFEYDPNLHKNRVVNQILNKK